MDPEHEPVFLSVEDVLRFHAKALQEYGGAEGIRDPGGLESAVGAVEQFACYASDIDLFDITAAYAFYIAEKQAFLEGNKRTAWATANAFLEVNGLNTSYDNNLIYDCLLAIAEHRLDRHGFAEILRERYDAGM